MLYIIPSLSDVSLKLLSSIKQIGFDFLSD